MLNVYCWKCGNRIDKKDVLGLGNFDKHIGKYRGKSIIAFKCPDCKKVRYQILKSGFLSIKSKLTSNNNYSNGDPISWEDQNNIDINQIISFFEEMKTINTVEDFLQQCNKSNDIKSPKIDKPIIQPLDVYNIFHELNNDNLKRMLILILDPDNYPIAWEMMGEGTSKAISFEPRIVFHIPFLLDDNVSVIIAENIKENFNRPSQKEIFVTKRLVKAAKILGIEFLDHIVIEKKGYHSFDQLNLL